MAESVLTSAMPPNASRADWIAVGAGALGALMATLDISITNSALPQIQGQIGATGSEGTWISTAYLMAEIVMIPLTAWLTRVFGLRTFLIGNALLFVLFSMVCGFADNLTQMIIGRLGQGFAGGAMIPTAHVLVATRLPRHQMPIGMTVFGLTVLLGPLLGPVIGGWLTENIDWRWCFFLNLPVCAVLVVMLVTGLPPARTRWSRFFKADWLGIAGLTLALSALTVALEEGQRERWFESSLIVGLSGVTVLGAVLLGIAQFTAKEPVVRLRLLANRHFAAVIGIVFLVGAGLYGVAYLLPQFLSGVAGYNAQQSGAVMLMSGLPAFLVVPLLPRLLARYDARLLVVIGIAALSLSCYLATGITAQSAGHDFTRSQLLLGVGQLLAMMPLNQLSMSSVPQQQAGDAAGLFNMARNLGGSVGLALLGTFLDRRTATHDDVLRESVTAASATGQAHIASLQEMFVSHHLDAATAHLQALTSFAEQIRLQAVVMTYIDTFQALALTLLICMPLAFLLRKALPGAPVTGH
ncbi:MDR family MFS transporter [Pseudomonas sp. Teo4]|uniref:MDR family MFS transporter n=1 Tax=Pseudomonas sp. Teo4 TaxID=3064528 RepID=UPI002ABCD0FA|nr:MDR family MFS transporter [Pseudomonas sp. Teo4]MDZ3991890.1 Colistin resistance protein EmrB [Pseudomonas sp. Teo4]